MSRYRDAGLFLALGLCWGGTFPAVEVGLTGVPPVLLGAIRFDVGALLMLGWVLRTADDPVPRARGDLVAIAIGATFLVTVNIVFLFVGQQFTTGGVAAIVYSLNPILTTAFAALVVGDEGLDPRGYVGVLLGIGGVVLVANPGSARIAIGQGTAFGVALVFVATVSVSLGSVLLRATNTTTGALTRTAWVMAAGAVQLHLVSLAFGEPVPPLTRLSPAVITAIVFLGVFASAVAYSIYFTLLDQLGPFQINLVSYLVPIVATVVGALLLAEPVTGFTIGGFLLIVVGFALVKRRAVAREWARLRNTTRGR